MSVSPDDLKRPETTASDWQEHARKKVKSDDKPDLFKSAEPVPEERKAPKWKQDQRSDQRPIRGRKKIRFDKRSADKTG